MLEATVVEATKFARDLGVEAGMAGRKPWKNVLKGRSRFTEAYEDSDRLVIS